MGWLRDRYGSDETPQEGVDVLGELTKRVKEDPMLGAKIVSGMEGADVGLKLVDILSEEFKKPVKKALEPMMDNLSNEPVMNADLQQAILGKTPVTMTPADIGMALGGSVTPRQAGDVALDIAIDPRTYLLGAGGKAMKAEAVAESIAPKIEANSPVGRIINALKEATPIRGQQEALYSAERARRAGAISGIGKSIEGEAGFHAQLGALKGELPKVQFEGLRGKITQPDVDSLFNSIEGHGKLLPFDKITAKVGLSKLLGEGGGAVPTKGELSLLSEVFPQEFIDTIQSKRPLLQKLGEGAGEVLNVPRALMASFDLSAPLRQGIFLVGRPRQFAPAVGEMFKSFFSEKAYQGLMEGIEQRATYPLMREAKLPLTNIGSQLSGREEKFMSNLAEHIPVAGKVVRASNRAYVGFLNKLRADTFDDMVRSAEKVGLKPEGKLLNDIGMFVGSATGRGKMPQMIEKSAVALNSVLFSPRLMYSRLNLLNPVYYHKLDPFVRKEALKSLLTFTGTASTIIGLAKLGGADVGTDARSADFGKIKVGNTRYDIGGGFLQYLRSTAQLITGKHVSSTTGVVSTVGEGYKPLTRFEIMQKFIETKESPVASFVTTLLKGQDAVGKKVDLKSEVAQRFVPLVLQDMLDLSKERGMQGVLMSIPAFFGVGMQTYSPTAGEMVQASGSVMKNYKELTRQGRVDEAEALLAKNQKIIEQAKTFEPIQKTVKGYERMREDALKDVNLTPSERKDLISGYDKKIKYYQDAMESKLKGKATDWERVRVSALSEKMTAQGDMTNKEYREYLKTTEGVVKPILEDLILKNPDWETMPDEVKNKLVSTVIKEARSMTKESTKKQKDQEAQQAFKSWKTPKIQYKSKLFQKYSQQGGK